MGYLDDIIKKTRESKLGPAQKQPGFQKAKPKPPVENTADSHSQNAIKKITRAVLGTNNASTQAKNASQTETGLAGTQTGQAKTRPGLVESQGQGSPIGTQAPPVAGAPPQDPGANSQNPQTQEAIPPAQEQPAEEDNRAPEVEISGKKTLLNSYDKVKIYKVENEHMLLYDVPVPKLKGNEEIILKTLKEAATRLITIDPSKIRDPKRRRNLYLQKVREIIKSSPELGVPSFKQEFYADAVVREMIGYGVLDMVVEDDKLEELMVIGPNKPVHVYHRDYGMMLTNIMFYKDSEIEDIIDRIARMDGKRVDRMSPLLDAKLADGSRVNATIRPASINGATITIRKFREDPFTITDLIKSHTVDTDLAAFLWVCVDGLGAKPANMLISGGTGSGKTTTLNVLSSFIPLYERVVTIEDTAELQLPLNHWIRLESRPAGLEGTGEITMDDLVKNSLRMRPDRIIVGEVRGGEASTLFTAMNTGHDGCFGTVHANSAKETTVRLQSSPMNVPKIMLGALNFIVIQRRIHDRRKGTIRRITEIAEVKGVLEGNLEVDPLYVWDAATDKMKSTGIPSKYLEEVSKYTGLNLNEIEKEIQARKKIIEKIVKSNVREMDKVCEITQNYISNKK